MTRPAKDAPHAKRASRRALYLLLFLGWAAVATFGGRDDQSPTSLALMTDRP